MPQTWLITGCSSGFGELFVRKLRAAGDNVIATGRSAEMKLSHLKDTGAEILDLDVSMSSDAIRAKIEHAWSLFPDGIDVVVNNAGYILSGAVEELNPEDLENVMKTNFYGPFHITQAILPKMRAKGKGTLLYMSSQAGWYGDPGASGYCSSKFALEGMAECLSRELAYIAPGIKILLVEPGYFSTSVFSKTNFAPLRNQTDYGGFFKVAQDYVADVIGNEPGDSDKAVDRMIDLVKGTGMAAGKTVPLRVPLGSDGWGKVKEKCEETLKICEEWEELAKSTDKKPAA
ncbi:NAD(P)-binding protein [Annulohypoxylon truncatum]|uniref:NAD(P)-binding protein n=1 Tax=Annulohypoxylon truncatum TaxID=327061 RepID=UPI002007F42A|nr:NAD(P)-binding protein [Annulohypoxylon truncatum]KAI1207607.1 NAD(P)-binding protein [Annulohypoxylon truncatum]